MIVTEKLITQDFTDKNLILQLRKNFHFTPSFHIRKRVKPTPHSQLFEIVLPYSQFSKDSFYHRIQWKR